MVNVIQWKGNYPNVGLGRIDKLVSGQKKKRQSEKHTKPDPKKKYFKPN